MDGRRRHRAPPVYAGGIRRPGPGPAYSDRIASIISHPFRLARDGSIATVDQTSDAGLAEQIAVLALTRPGERPLVPGFGLPDPTFEGFEPSALAAAVALWGPDVLLDQVTVVQRDDSTQQVEVSFR